MGSYAWKGVTTGRRYEWMERAIPSVLLDPRSQQPLLIGTYDSETVIASNHDGSVAMPVATGPPLGASVTPLPLGTSGNDIYDCYVLFSLWEQQVESQSAQEKGAGGFAMFPFAGGSFG